MSGAHVTNMQILRRAKKIRSPEDAKFMKLFGATDLYLNNTKGIGPVAMPDLGLNSDLGWAAPISSGIPLSSDSFIPIRPVTQRDAVIPKQAKASMSSTQTETKGDRKEPSFAEGEAHSSEKHEVGELLSFLDEAGVGVGEVKTLPSGATKITLEDLFGPMHTKEPEFVRVGARQ